jgi:hypothetical protein
MGRKLVFSARRSSRPSLFSKRYFDVLPALLVWVLGCSSPAPQVSPGGDGGAPPVAAQTVGPEGGSVTHPEGASFSVPSGGLTSATELWIDPAAQGPKQTWFTPLGKTYEIGPSGLVFETPAEIELPLDAKSLPEGASTSEVKVYTSTDHGLSWSALETTVADAAVKAKVSHLSLFVLGLSKCGSATCPKEIQAVFEGKRLIERVTDDLSSSPCIAFEPIHRMLRPENQRFLSKPIDQAELSYAKKYGYRLVKALPLCQAHAKDLPKWVVFSEPLSAAEQQRDDGTPRPVVHVDKNDPCCIAVKLSNNDVGPLRARVSQALLAGQPACAVSTAAHAMSDSGGAIIEIAGGVYSEPGVFFLGHNVGLRARNNENVTIMGLLDISNGTGTGSAWGKVDALSDGTGDTYAVSWNDHTETGSTDGLGLPLLVDGKNPRMVVHLDKSTVAEEKSFWSLENIESQRALSELDPNLVGPVGFWANPLHSTTTCAPDSSINVKSHRLVCAVEDGEPFPCDAPPPGAPNCCVIVGTKSGGYEKDGAGNIVKALPPLACECRQTADLQFKQFYSWNGAASPPGKVVPCDACSPMARTPQSCAEVSDLQPPAGCLDPPPGKCAVISLRYMAKRALKFCRAVLGDQTQKCLLLKLPKGKKPADYAIEAGHTQLGLLVFNNPAHTAVRSGVWLQGIQLKSFPVEINGLPVDRIKAKTGLVGRLNGVHLLRGASRATGQLAVRAVRVENSYFERSYADARGSSDTGLAGFRLRNNYIDRAYGKPIVIEYSGSVGDVAKKIAPANLHALKPLCTGSACDSSVELFSGKENFEQWKHWGLVSFNVVRNGGAIAPGRLFGLAVVYNDFVHGGAQEGLLDNGAGCSHCLIHHNWVSDGVGVGMIHGELLEDIVVSDNQFIRQPGDGNDGAGTDADNARCKANPSGCRRTTPWSIGVGGKGYTAPTNLPDPYVCKQVTIENNLAAGSVFGGIAIQACNELSVRFNTVANFKLQAEDVAGGPPASAFSLSGGPAAGNYQPMTLAYNVAYDAAYPKALGITGGYNGPYMSTLQLKKATSVGNYLQSCDQTKCALAFLSDDGKTKIVTDSALAGAKLTYSDAANDHYQLSGFPAALSDLCAGTGRYRHPGFNYQYELCGASGLAPAGSTAPSAIHADLASAEVQLKGLAQACQWDQHCEAGLLCRDSKCGLEPELGHGCTADCGPFLKCSNGKCAAIAVAGERCDSDKDCGSYMKCLYSKIEGAAKIKVCTAKCGGETCGVKPEDLCLGKGLACVKATCQWVKSLANGDPCAASVVCKSGFCVDNMCCDTACGSEDEVAMLADCQACSLLKGGKKDGECGAIQKDTVCRKAKDVCDAEEVCDGANKECSVDGAAAKGKPCDDENACTEKDACDGEGLCAGVQLTCLPSKECNAAGTCDSKTGKCGGELPAPNGSQCEDGSCVDGACVVSPTGWLCGAGSQCQSGYCVNGICCKTPCDSACQICGAQGLCENVPDGQTCTGGACKAGACVSSTTPDGGTVLPDSGGDGAPSADAAVPNADAGAPPDISVIPDAGVTIPDAGVIAPDLGKDTTAAPDTGPLAGDGQPCHPTNGPQCVPGLTCYYRDCVTLPKPPTCLPGMTSGYVCGTPFVGGADAGGP